MKRDSQKITFDNVPGLVKYLNGLGYVVSLRTAYRHEKQGRIRKRTDGKFHLSDIEKYSRFLKRADGTVQNDELETLQREKYQAEVKKLTSQAEHWELKTKIASKQYVPRDSFEHALAARAAIFKSDGEHFCMSEASGIIHLVGGDHLKVPQLVEFLLEAFRGWLARYAEQREYEVLFDAAPEAENDAMKDPDEEEDEETQETEQEPAREV